jgi:hypothetical protein
MPDNATQLARQNEALTRQFLEWVASAPHTYREALEVWRSSCPRHTIWEDAFEAGFLQGGAEPDDPLTLTGPGRAWLQETRA